MEAETHKVEREKSHLARDKQPGQDAEVCREYECRDEVRRDEVCKDEVCREEVCREDGSCLARRDEEMPEES